MRRAVAASCGLHGTALLVLAAGSLLAPIARPPLPFAAVELVMQDTPAVGAGGGAGRPPSNPAPRAAAAAPAAPPPAGGVRPPAARPAPAAAAPAPAASAAARGAGETGTGRVTGDHVIPARPEEAHNAPPPYPADAAQRGEQGMITMLIHVAADGRPTAVDILASSGFADLDAAARKAVLAWHFVPALRDGAPVASELPFNIHYLLPGPGASP